MSSSNQTIVLSEDIVGQINRDADALLALQGIWTKQHLVDGMTGFAYSLLCGKVNVTAQQGPTALECALKLILNSDQGPHEKLYNIKALLEVK